MIHLSSSLRCLLSATGIDLAGGNGAMIPHLPASSALPSGWPSTLQLQLRYPIGRIEAEITLPPDQAWPLASSPACPVICFVIARAGSPAPLYVARHPSRHPRR
ncbi:hypothetical protein BO71DRAFT_394522 [Aspergillus ellipticus CBS 707.79]|uniref:Uncharacterized protein n=1 Tax=Aspergillus ellipticus CBS 707.79 TaxID=1448320 RepID=A0A319DNE3_9EURO|nr:hypothetical protein BO71DRAFT_394522 [Aspergillus ellipticus CBS 707.79]